MIETTRFHRAALAVDDAGAAHAWFQRVLGAGVWSDPDARDPLGRIPNVGEGDLAGAQTRALSVRGCPFILLSNGAPDGPLANFLRRYGPAVHSLAWEVEDMWATQNLLIERGVRTASVNISGRHFFTHPRDTHGLLVEWTDVRVADDSCHGDGGGAVDVEGVAWFGAAVADAQQAASFLGKLVGAEQVSTNATGPTDRELTVDVRVGDVTIRLVTPRSPHSPYAPYLCSGPRLCTVGLRVSDLDAALSTLRAEDVGVVRRDDGVAATDPAATFGLPIEWTTSTSPTRAGIGESRRIR